MSLLPFAVDQAQVGLHGAQRTTNDRALTLKLSFAVRHGSGAAVVVVSGGKTVTAEVLGTGFTGPPSAVSNKPVSVGAIARAKQAGD